MECSNRNLKSLQIRKDTECISSSILHSPKNLQVCICNVLACSCYHSPRTDNLSPKIILTPDKITAHNDATTLPFLSPKTDESNTIGASPNAKKYFSFSPTRISAYYNFVATNADHLVEAVSKEGKPALEKSNSTEHQKTSKSLRTTRSLSPRPPITHQHAITVSDENDVTSVKVSPNDDLFIFNMHQKHRKSVQQKQVELEATKKNIETEDPWKLMQNTKVPKQKSADDPWERRQKLEFSNIESKGHKPKLERKTYQDASKNDSMLKFKSTSTLKCNEIDKGSQHFITNSGPQSLSFSTSPDQRKAIFNLSPTLNHTASATTVVEQQAAANKTLFVSTVQPRRSFSNTSNARRDEELPLNIRRLSDQVRTFHTSVWPTQISHEQLNSSNDNKVIQKKTANNLEEKNRETPLETRC